MLKNLPNLFLRIAGRLKATAKPQQSERLAAPEAMPARAFNRVVLDADGDTGESARHGEYQIAEREVFATAELPPFIKSLQADVSIRDELKHSICPVQLRPVSDEHKRVFAIVLIRDMVGNDVVDQIYSDLQKKGYRPDSPAVYVATQAVVSELARADSGTDVASRLAADRDSPFYKIFVDIAEFAVANGVSDIHFRYRAENEYSPTGFRMDGNVIRPKKFRIQSGQMLRMLSFWYSFRGNSTSTSSYSEREVLQCQIEETIGGQRLGFRWSQFPIHKGLKVTLRVMQLDASDVYTSLGMRPNGAGLPEYQEKTLLRALRADGGGWVISGRVNSGKSKLLQTIVGLLPSHFEINTAEDPIEYLHNHEGANQHSTSRGIGDDDGKDAFTPFSMANKRTDPDATVISELRDVNTTSAYRDAVLAGQPSFCTIHAPNALAIPQRLISEEFGLSLDVVTMPDFLKMLIHLALVPKNCQSCALPVNDPHTLEVLKAALNSDDPAIVEIAATSIGIASTESLNRVHRLFSFDVSGMKVRNPHGCSHCMREGVPELNGIRGRTPVAQIIEPTTDMLLLIRESKNIELQHYYRSLRTAGFDSDNSDGKTPFEIAMYKVARGEICLSMAEKRFQTIDQYEHEQARLFRRTNSLHPLTSVQ